MECDAAWSMDMICLLGCMYPNIRRHDQQTLLQVQAINFNAWLFSFVNFERFVLCYVTHACMYVYLYWSLIVRRE